MQTLFRLLNLIKIGEDDYMPTAFVLINSEIGSESEVLKTLKKVDAVEEAYTVYGVYDVVAKVKADTMGNLKEIITQHVRRLDKVRSTLTMIVTEETE
jgi:DNA-binding Lrp family transcriptional regulator